MKRWALIALASLLGGGCAHFEPKELAPARSAADLQARTLDSVGLLEFVRTNLPATSLAPASGSPPAIWNLEALTLVGLYQHPGLAVARAQWEVARAGVLTAEGRPNPVLGLTPGYNFSTSGGGPGALASPWLPLATLDWPIETAGKRGYRQARALHLAESARLTLVQAAWQVRASVRAALLEVAYSEARAMVLAEQAGLESQLTEVTQQRLAAGAATVLEASRRRVAGNKARLELSEAQRLAALARARLAETLGLPVAALREARLDFAFVPGPDAGMESAQAAWRDAALLGRADVLGALSDFAASQSALQLEIARQYPDLHLGNGYQYDQGDHKWTVGLTFELPVLNQNQGPIADARARREEAIARFTAVQARVLAQVEQALINRGMALAGFGQAGTLNASQAEAVRATEASLNAGGSDRLELLTIQLESTLGRVAWLDAAYRVQQALGQLEDAVQRPFTGLGTVGIMPDRPTPSP